MSEVSEMMMEGYMCEMCGSHLDGEVADCAQQASIPSYCSKSCANDRGATWWIEWIKEDFNNKVT